REAFTPPTDSVEAMTHLRTATARPSGCAVVALLLVLVGCTSPREEPSPGGEPGSAAPSASAATPRPSSAESPADGAATSLRLAPPPRGSFLVRGRYPIVP